MQQRKVWILLFLGVVALVYEALLQSGEIPEPIEKADSTNVTSKQDFVLALTWHPGFCATKAHLPECKSHEISQFAKTNLVLHGLWPGGRSNIYCDNNYQPNKLARHIIDMDKNTRQWRSLPMPALTKPLQTQINIKMPGAISGLDKHEWIKHGTCFSPEDPETYFKTSLSMLDVINQSSLLKYLRSNTGRNITRNGLVQSLSTSFGNVPRDVVQLKCQNINGRNIITEVRFALSGPIQAFVTDPGTDSLARMLKNQHNAFSGGQCQSGFLRR